MPRDERIVIGAGPAGCAVALHLARGGAAPLLLERSQQPRPRLCGEFISAEAVAALAQLGVDVWSLGGQPTHRLRLVQRDRIIEAELPFTACGLSRRALDGALQKSALAAGVPLWRGARVGIQRLASAQQPFELQVHTAHAPTLTLHTQCLLLACGKTDLAPLQRRARSAPEPLLGLQAHLRLQPDQLQALRGHVEVMLFDAGYGGLQPVEGDRVNLCLLLRHERGQRAGHGHGADLQALLQGLQHECPLLAQRLRGAVWDDDAPRSAFRVPYGYLHRASDTDPPGLWRLGDQAAVIPSYTGDGVAIALHSAELAARMLLAGAGAQRYHRRLHSDLRLQMGGALALYRLGAQPRTRALLWPLLQRWPALPRWLARMTRLSAGGSWLADLR